MKIVYNKIMYDVIAVVGHEKKSYFVMDRFGKLFFTTKEIEEIIGNQINGRSDEFGNFFELDYLNDIAIYKIWGKDFVDDNEKIKYNDMENKIYEDYSKFLRREIKKDYYKYKIEKKEMEIWENNFDEKVYSIEENKYYIDDEEFDIFYEIDEENNYKFEFFEK